MSQQDFSQFAPKARISSTESIPFVGIDAQTRDGKDELIVGAGNMYFDPTVGSSGMWLPVTKENPLPVEGKVELTGSPEVTLTGRVVYEDHREADPLPSGSSEIVSFEPPSEKIWFIHGVGFRALNPGGDSEHEHIIELWSPTIGTPNRVLSGSSPGNAALTLTISGFFDDATRSQNPDDPLVQMTVVRGILLQGSLGIHLRYTNNSGATQSIERRYRIVALERDA